MTWFIPSEIAQMTIMAVLSLVFFYLYFYDNQHYILLWAMGWLTWSIKYLLEIILYFDGSLKGLILLNLICWFLGGVLLCYGTLSFLEKNISKIVLYGMFSIPLWVIISFTISLPIQFQIIPIHLFLGILYCLTGFSLLSGEDKNLLVHKILGVFFLLGGIHVADYPFLINIKWIAPWGYLIAAIINIVIANGTLLAYYQEIWKELSKRESRFRLLADNAQDIIFRFQVLPKRTIEYISPSASKVTGYPIEDFYNNPNIYKKLIHPEDWSLLNNPEYFSFNKEILAIRWVKKDGVVIWVEQHNTIIYDESGNISAFEGIIRDITDRKNAEEKIRKADESRRNLTTSISHELRTPMTSIQGYIEAIIDGVITDVKEVSHYLNIVLKRIKIINRLVDDLFNLSRFESGGINFNFTEISIKNLIREVYIKFKADVENEGINFILNAPYNKGIDISAHKINKDILDKKVSVDFNRIDQIFSNLIGNAIKHTPKNGTILLFYDLSNDKKELLISIKDNGYGISEKDLPYIFDRFYKTSDARNSAKDSNGLGLAITKEIVKAHNGQIWAESVEGEGSTFTFTLPTL